MLKSADDFIKGLPKDSQLREVLEQFKEEGHATAEEFKARLQTWFDDVMWQASGWYKRHLQFVTFFVGLGIAIVLNADSFQIYSHLSTNANSREQLSAAANAFVGGRDTLVVTPAAPNQNLTTGQVVNGIQAAANDTELRNAYNILGLGWESEDLRVNFRCWLLRLLGWLITALAISLGAPFWFDVLKKIITIQSTGSAPANGGNGGAQVIINTGSGDAKQEVKQ